MSERKLEENNNNIVTTDPNQTDLERRFGFMGQKESNDEIKKIFGFKSMENRQIGTLFGML